MRTCSISVILLVLCAISSLVVVVMSDGAEAFFSALLSIGVSQEIAGVVTESIRRTDEYGGRLQTHEDEIKRLSGVCEQVSR